jgi:type II secretory pathway component PulF
METYTYKARTIHGLSVRGSMRADRRQTVVNLLKRKGYFLTYLGREQPIVGVLRRGISVGSRVGMRDKAVFSHQLSTLLKAGMRIVTALETLARQSENTYLTAVLEQIRAEIEDSSSLSEAMEKHPDVFSKVYTSIIRAAEESGRLAETLAILAKQLKSQCEVHSRIRAALAYPIFLLVVSAVVVGILTAFVVPKFTRLFISENQAMPLPTKLLVGFNDMIGRSWVLIVVAMCGLAGLGVLAWRNERLRLAVDRLLLRVPGLAAVNKKLLAARFVRTFGSLLNGGVPIVSSIKTTKATITNRAFAGYVGNIEGEILKGASVAKALSKQEHFSPMLTNMIAVGEETGMLPEMLIEVADIYDQEAESAINTLTTLLGPFMIVILGSIIGFVVLAILLPIFQTTSLVH